MAGLAAVLGVAAAVLLVAVWAVRVSARLGLPSLLLYLGIGLVLGVIGIRYDNAQLTQYLGTAALVLILTEGGLTTRWSTVRSSLGLGVVLSTVAVLVSILATGLLLHVLLDLDWRTAMLWGSVLSSTDAAAVFSVLRGVHVSRRLSGALELESGLNDAPVYLAVILLAGTDPLTWQTPLVVAYELVVGAIIGMALGWGGGWLLRHAALPATGLYPLATFAVCVLAFTGGTLAHASGLLATYVCALRLGNSHLPHRANTLSFAEGMGWMAQIGLFVLLGLFATPSQLVVDLIPGLIAGAVLVFVARPLSVLIAATPFRVPWRQQAFLSWAGLRGAVPIVLALIPLSEGRPNADHLVSAVFVLVVVLTLVQGGTLPWVARMLGLAQGSSQPEELEVDSAPLDELRAGLLQVRIQPGSKLHGVYLYELRLPVGAVVSLVVRKDQGFTPDSRTRLQQGDQLLVVATDAVREATERRIRAVDRAGRYAKWKGEKGT
ncbi:MAG TPA: potassium/proton antiporter [Pseudonocardiaceae bacterium]